MTQVTAEMLRRGRDLRDQDDALRAERDGIIFMETSERQAPITLYAMSDGEPIPMSPKIAELAIRKRFRDGTYMFTDKQEEAPEYKYGEVKCFLHPESWERTSGLLEAAGIAGVVCHSAKHPSRFAMQEVAKSKHKKEWQAKLEYEREQERKEERDDRRKQLEATLALASKAANSSGSEWLDAAEKAPGEAWVQAAAEHSVEKAEEAVVKCEQCGQHAPSGHASPEGWLRGHKMGAHKGGEG